MADVEGASDKENVEQVAIPILLDEEIDTRGHPEILREELQLAFPEYNPHTQALWEESQLFFME